MIARLCPGRMAVARFQSGKSAGHVFASAAEAIGQEGGIAGQRYPAERQCRRFEIEDRLKERFRSQKNLSQLRRETRLGVDFDPRDDLIANERRRNPAPVQLP